jgi:hypothetical protein
MHSLVNYLVELQTKIARRHTARAYVNQANSTKAFTAALFTVQSCICNFELKCPYTAISIKVVPEQSGKVEYERERLLGIAKKSLFFSDSQQAFRARIRLLRFARGQPYSLIEIAVYDKRYNDIENQRYCCPFTFCKYVIFCQKSEINLMKTILEKLTIII